jgi:class 3 adenylate cyclase
MKSRRAVNRAKQHAEHLTIMMLDLCGYTHISSRLSRQTLHELHEVFDDLAIPAIEEHHGTVVKKIGDAFLATFKSPTNALHCARELQNKFHEYNRTNRPRYPLSIKIALHPGEVIVKDNDIYGDAVNITARIEGIAEDGQILFSGSLFSAMNKNEINSIYLGRRKFKGVEYPVKIFMVRPNLRRRVFSSNVFKNIGWWILVILIVYFLIVVGRKIF